MPTALRVDPMNESDSGSVERAAFLEPTDTFVRHHISPTPGELEHMLSAVGAASLEALQAEGVAWALPEAGVSLFEPRFHTMPLFKSFEPRCDSLFGRLQRLRFYRLWSSRLRRLSCRQPLALLHCLLRLD